MEKNQLDSPKWYLFISDRNPQTCQSLLSLQCMMILPKVGIAQGAGKVMPSPSSGRPGLSSQKPWRPSWWRLTPDPQALYLRGRVHLGCLQHFILTQFCSIVLELLKTTIIFLLNKSSLFSFLSDGDARGKMRSPGTHSENRPSCLTPVLWREVFSLSRLAVGRILADPLCHVEEILSCS